MKSKALWISLLTVMIAIIFGVGYWVNDELYCSSEFDNVDLSLFESDELVLIPDKISGEGVSLYVAGGDNNPRILRMAVMDLNGLILSSKRTLYEGDPMVWNFEFPLKTDELYRYTIRYSEGNDPYTYKSLYHMFGPLQTIVLGQESYYSGSEAEIRLITRNIGLGNVVGDASVDVELIQNDEVIARSQGTTNEAGTLNVSLPIPRGSNGRGNIKISVKSDVGSDEINAPIEIEEGNKILLTTDKPIYQPGQTINIRSLSLAFPNMEAISEEYAKIEVYDSNGNKVFKEEGETNDYGIFSANFLLASELNLGDYKIVSTTGSTTTEKTVQVMRYVLPKFKIEVETDKSFYLPGEEVSGTVYAEYFFGQPVSNAEVTLDIQQFTVQYTTIETVDGELDDEGKWEFAFDLPEYFTGSELEQGQSHFLIHTEVVDNAEHMEETDITRPVPQEKLLITLVPESGTLVQDLDNKVYMVVTNPNGEPVQTELKVIPNNNNATAINISTDAGGFATFSVKPTREDLNITVEGTTREYSDVEKEFDLTVEYNPEASILMRTNKGIYQVGDEIPLTVYSTRQTGVVYVDVIKNSQTLLTSTAALDDGVAQVDINLDNTLAGTITLSAYILSRDGHIIRDRKVVIVEPASDLNIDFELDRESYKPGEEALLNLTVTDSEGQARQAVIGLMIVDEAVYALSELHPGLEKVYFYLEEELLKPRIEIHGIELPVVYLDDKPVIQPIGAGGENFRQKSATVLLAAMEELEGYSVQIDTYVDQNKEYEYTMGVSSFLQDKFTAIYNAGWEYYYDNNYQYPNSIRDIIGYEDVTSRTIKDPWGNEMVLGDYIDTITSKGPDGELGTYDDITYNPYGYYGWEGEWEENGELFLMDDMAMNGGAVRMRNEMARGAMPDEAPGQPMLMTQEATTRSLNGDTESSSAEQTGGAANVRIRKYFPETLLFEPSLITDARGRAQMNIPLADSITTWRISAMANTIDGLMGSAEGGILVFQDFFIDIDFPVSLTQNDEISVPIAIYNYMDRSQQVRIVVEEEDWFEILEGDNEQTKNLEAGQVDVVYFKIKADKVGFQNFTVFGYGSQLSDAITREIEIVPDGEKIEEVDNGRLEGDIDRSFTIPVMAIDDASNIIVKIYPGVLAQVMEGLDGMLRYPSGCFEQTSSATYPNILILAYLRETGKSSPETEMTAEGMINVGYQRLLSYEVPGGGFSWFGDAPAHNVLTVYGLMEFTDMSRVIDIDQNIITRTQNYLVNLQNNDGSWRPSEGGIQEGAINEYVGDVLRTTVYTLWGLAYSGYQGEPLNKAKRYASERVDEMDDAYTLAIAANAFATIDPDSAVTEEILEKLEDQIRVNESEGTAYINYQGMTSYYGTGEYGKIETTGLAVQAMLLANYNLRLVEMMNNYLIGKKDSLGTWGSTQATIQTLRALLMTTKMGSVPSSGDVDITINDERIDTIRITERDSDVMRLISLKDYVKEGRNEIEIDFDGDGNLFYQITNRFYIPYEEEEEIEPFTITVDYDRTRLSTNDILEVHVEVINNTQVTAKMPLIDLGLPPGFDLDPSNLQTLEKNEVISRFDTTPRQIIVYMEELGPRETVEIDYNLIAKFPLRAMTTASRVYEYYNPDNDATADPIQLEVVD